MGCQLLDSERSRAMMTGAVGRNEQVTASGSLRMQGSGSRFHLTSVDPAPRRRISVVGCMGGPDDGRLSPKPDLLSWTNSAGLSCPEFPGIRLNTDMVTNSSEVRCHAGPRLKLLARSEECRAEPHPDVPTQPHPELRQRRRLKISHFYISGLLFLDVTALYEPLLPCS